MQEVMYELGDDYELEDLFDCLEPTVWAAASAAATLPCATEVSATNSSNVSNMVSNACIDQANKARGGRGLIHANMEVRP